MSVLLQTGKEVAKQEQESLEERRLRLQFQRDQLKSMKVIKEEEKQEKHEDPFKNIFDKHNETDVQKKARLMRSLKALKACSTDRPKATGLLNDGKLNIKIEDGNESEPYMTENETEVVTLKKGKRVEDLLI